MTPQERSELFDLIGQRAAEMQLACIRAMKFELSPMKACAHLIGLSSYVDELANTIMGAWEGDKRMDKI